MAKRAEELTDRPWVLVIDGLFGIGSAEPAHGDHAKLVDRQRCPVLTCRAGSSPIPARRRAVRASHTMARDPRPAHLDGPDHCGEVTVASLGLDVAALFAPSAWVGGM